MNELANITHCPRTDSPRRDIGCLHCPFLLKLGDVCTCLFPQEGYGKGGGLMTWLEKYTAYKPMQATTTTTSWSGWRPMSSRCCKCAHYALVSGVPVCHCVSRTAKHGAHGDECVSYREVDDAGA